MALPGRADGTFVSPTLPFTSLPPIDVFAVEDTVAQLSWRGLPSGPLTATVQHPSGPESVELGDAAVPGAADVGGFAAGSSTPVDVVVNGRRVAQPVVSTLETLPGAPTTRIATISDLHLGEEGFGLIKRLREPKGTEPYSLRCAKAAVREAQAWGAELLVIKGDITEFGMPDEWELFDELLADIHIPILAIPGNHDTLLKRGSLDATTELQRRSLFPAPINSVEIGGVRVVTADSTVPGHSFGRLGRWTEHLATAVDTDTPVLVFTHHHFEHKHWPRLWPLGVQQFDNEALLHTIFEANPDLLISSGHTHRNRVRPHRTGLLTEVSATKDYPGVWAGYTVHPTGVRQVVRRIAEPSCIAWNDRTHAVVGGIWGRWSPGRLADRSVNHTWTRDYRSRVADRQISTTT